jgi:uncharacterized protein YecE (DUF72 family)
MDPPIHIGCCGFQKARRVYFAHFSAVEVQQTFYKLPRLATAERWRAEAPPGFMYTMKAWQAITHTPASPTYRKSGLRLAKEDRDRYGAFRPSDEVRDAWRRTLEIARAMAARVVVFQCPASFTPDKENLANLRAFFQWAERDGLIFAWEPRGAWPDELIERLCRELDLIHCVDPFERPSVHGVPVYYRLHGRNGYDYRYSDGELLQLQAWCRHHPEIYCMFNNVTMWEDALRFKNLQLSAHDTRNDS